MGPFTTCVGCHGRRELELEAGGFALCASCRDELEETTKPRRASLGQWSLDTHWTYGGLLRELILRVKVQGDQRALSYLRARAAVARRGMPRLDSFDAVIAAPSSLYGRILGRLDLAGCIAADLARECRGRTRSAPYSLQARWRKRSRIKDRTAADAGARFEATRFAAFLDERWTEWVAPMLRGKRIAVVDDVVTTGHTLLATARAIQRHVEAEVELLALASALK